MYRQIKLNTECLILIHLDYWKFWTEEIKTEIFDNILFISVKYRINKRLGLFKNGNFNKSIDISP